MVVGLIKEHTPVVEDDSIIVIIFVIDNN